MNSSCMILLLSQIFCDSVFLFNSCLKVKGRISRSNRKFGKPVLPNAISPTDFITSIITAFCDSFGRCPLVFYGQPCN